MSPSLSIALLGAGRIGQVHAAAIAETAGARLCAVADINPEAARALATRYGAETRAFTGLAEAPDIDAVIICTPTDTHAALIETFARARKPVFCEKPIDLSLARVKACLKVVAKTGTPLMVGFNRRFDPQFVALKQSINAGRIGNIEMLNITSRDPAPPPAAYIRNSGGLFRDMTIHDFDMARFLLQDPIRSVMARASALVSPEIGALGDFDSANILLTTDSGKQCVISNSRRASYGYDQRIEVLGEKGLLSARNLRPIEVELASADGFCRPPLHDFFMTRYSAAYRAEIAAFVEMLRSGDPASPSGQDGLCALELAEAALRSVQTGRAVSPGAMG